ncbi:RimK family protein [Thioalkalivibrio sp. ALJ7]|uniref:RimK family protein n=1 Tax=Thioalkalivibrio sp. ALJ7 TaxID=1158756 RepID=UPI000382D849|nr:RimK family protein [Thioalkalivibrio sp. ALJ7]
MANHLLLIEQPEDWKPHFPDYPVMLARDYLAHPPATEGPPLRVINLCRGHRYLSVGYYCSLLAEARHHRVVPTVRTLQDLSRKSIYSLDTGDIDRKVARVLGRRASLQATAFEMIVFFGHCIPEAMQEIAQQLFAIFPAPMFRVEFRLAGQWRIEALRPLSLQDLTSEQEEAFFAALDGYLARRWRKRRGARGARYDLAILQNPEEALPPSNRGALKQFIRHGRALGLEVELIQRRDLTRLAEYDALFIRETTRIDHYTYRFARKAEAEGMVVIDDPDSILRCTNKVYLAELLTAHRIATPRTLIVSRDNLLAAEETIGYPIVLKIPDGSFSRGVFKVENRDELESTARGLFRESDLILAQEFTYTEFDWRIGILNRQPLYACQYFMSRKHWQIVNHAAKGSAREGGFRTLPIEEAPPTVIKTALRAANRIGDGLYGVDLKQTAHGVVVIEVNDNPNLDAGIEDAVLGERLYQRILEDLIRRLDHLRQR